jgi:hypothetical protein
MVVLLLQFCYKPYTAASQNLHYKNRKNRIAVFSTRFLGIFLLLRFLEMPKNRPYFRNTPAILRKKRPTVTAPQKIAGGSEKMRAGPAGRETLIFSADRPRAFLCVL